MATISTHNGSSAHRDHNIRNPKVVSKEKHIQDNGHYEIWKDETPRQAYNKLFNEALKKYNENQIREDRKIKDYYSHILKDKKKHPVYEMIIGIYPSDKENISEETQRLIMKNFVDTWQDRNPNLYMCGAYYHSDEEGEPHCHIDYIPIAHGYVKGMEVQTGLVKALGEQGIEKQGKLTAQIQWEKKQNNYLQMLCNRRGIIVEHPKQEVREHLATEVYKAEKELESTLNSSKDLLVIKDNLKAEISKLEAIRDEAEIQADKALKRKEKAFSASWKKDKEEGWRYDRGLEREIVSLLNERAEDVKAISHTNLELDVSYKAAIQAQEEAEKNKELAKKELEKAQKYKNEQKEYILGASHKIAGEIFKDYIDKKFETITKDKTKRLEEYCKNVKFADGSSVLDKFEENEIEKRKEIEKEWEEEFDR